MSEITLYHGDCLEVMPSIPSGTVDMILADLPYGNGDRDKRAVTAKWDRVLPLSALWKQYERLLTPDGVIVLTASQPFTSLLVASNLKWFRCEWIWKKTRGSGFLNANRQPLKRHETVLVFAPRQPKYHPQFTQGTPYTAKQAGCGRTVHNLKVIGWVTTNSGMRYPTTVLEFGSETGHHPTQKPVALMEYLIRTYTNEGETVLDNTMGSGTTGVACINTGRNFIGIERDAGYFQIATERIHKAQVTPRQLEIPA